MHRYLLFSFFLCCYACLPAQQQEDIYQYKNAIRFADYLKKTGQYELAIEELERIRFLHPENDSVTFILIQTCRLGGFCKRGTALAENLFPDPVEMPSRYASEYNRMLLLGKEFDKAGTFAANNRNFREDQKYFFLINCELMQQRWKASEELFDQIPSDIKQHMSAYGKLISDANATKYKHGGIALALSAVVPGCGKLYTKNWGDAVMSFITTGALAFQAYRGFRQGGTKSAYGWVFGTLAFGFYSGNLYGSYKASQVYNAKLNEKIQSRTMALFNLSDY